MQLMIYCLLFVANDINHKSWQRRSKDEGKKSQNLVIETKTITYACVSGCQSFMWVGYTLQSLHTLIGNILCLTMSDYCTLHLE